MSIKDEIKEQFRNLPNETIQYCIDKKDAELNDAFNNGRQVCLLKTLDILVDSSLK